MVETLAQWRCFADVSGYDGRPVPFLKRAQIAAADLQRAGVADFGDLDRLTMFADNLVPHVLRLDGVLWFDPELVARIERGELIEHGSPEEVEIRACAVHAVELLVAASGDRIPHRHATPHGGADRRDPLEPRSGTGVQGGAPAQSRQHRLLSYFDGLDPFLGDRLGAVHTDQQLGAQRAARRADRRPGSGR